MHLIEPVKHGATPLIAHPAGSVLVDRASEGIDVSSVIGQHFRLHGVQDLLNLVVHRLDQLPFVVADVEIDVGYRHAVAIQLVLVCGDAVPRPRQDLPERMQFDPRWVAFLDRALEALSESGQVPSP